MNLQHIGGFLAGLQRKRLAVPRRMVADAAHHVAHGGVIRVRRVSGTKPMWQAMPGTPSCAAKSLTSKVRASRAARVTGGTKPTVRATAGRSV
jgi:hypothetical protein